MATVILVIHLILALAIILLVMLQRSEGGGLGIGGGGGMGGLATAGQTANVLTRATAICAGLFFITSLTLAVLAGTHRGTSVLDNLETTTEQQQGLGPTTDPLPDNVDPAAPATSNPMPRAAGTEDERRSPVDSSVPNSDKKVPRADDKSSPQNGAPSAPISQ